jgi:hypothetical protein
VQCGWGANGYDRKISGTSDCCFKAESDVLKHLALFAFAGLLTAFLLVSYGLDLSAFFSANRSRGWPHAPRVGAGSFGLYDRAKKQLYRRPALDQIGAFLASHRRLGQRPVDFGQSQRHGARQSYEVLSGRTLAQVQAIFG